MKGDKIFAEGYWKPFHQDFCHRQYSQTKSFVGVAIFQKTAEYFLTEYQGETVAKKSGDILKNNT